MNPNDNNWNKRNNQVKDTQKNLNKGFGSFSNGYNSVNNYQKKKTDTDSIASRIESSRQKARRENASKAIRTSLNTVAPGTGEVANKMLKTEKGEELIDAYTSADSHTEGLANVAKKIKEESNKKKLIIFLLLFLGGILFLMLLVLLIFKNADTQIYSNQNGGKIDTEQFPDNDLINPNIFVKYPGIYEKVEAATQKVSKEYKVDIDRYLILATLIAPIENGNIIPVKDNSCGETECYYLNNKSYTWSEFLELWADQAEYLAKSQILTYVNQDSNINVSCGKDDTMEQYAKNDLEVNNFSIWGLFNPVNWFKGFRNVAEAELNAKCIMDVPSGKSTIPTVYVLSKEQGIYYNSVNANHERTYVKDPNSGGVYFWNLVNNGGFIHVYMRDYLNINENYTDDQNYDENLPTILDIANYIYSYYESIRKDCYGYGIIESTIEKIKVKHKNDDGYDLIDFEEQYIGGVIMAEFASGNLDAEKAMAILARTEAVAIVGLDGEKIIENSSNHQNYNGAAYNPTYDPSYENQEDNPNYDPDWPKVHLPKIYEAVQSTRGMVISNYGSDKVKHTEYDAFCPVTNKLDNGFYYLPDGQNNLPINPSAYTQKTSQGFNISEKYLECPCFQNNNSTPADTLYDGQRVRFSTSPNVAPNYSGGTPSQETLASCWSRDKAGKTGPTRTDIFGQTEYGWYYKATGGHGRGASQYGLKYFAAFEYEWEALLKLFFGDISIRKLSSSLNEGECQNASTFDGGTSTSIDSCGVNFEVTDSNYTKRIAGSALNSSLTQALSNNGYSIECLNSCISKRVNAAGMGTREAVVEAAVGLLECTMEMTGGFTYPYDHRGGWVSATLNPDITGKLGVNSNWGIYHESATGCSTSKCRLGLNCANFVRWSMCNGGMDLCSRGSTFATGMAGVLSRENENYFPGAIRVFISGSKITTKPNITIGELSSEYQSNLRNYSTSTKLSSVSIDEVLSLIKPGDVLYSDVNGNGNHVMVIVGVEDSAIWIAENGRQSRKISYSDIKSGKKNYVVLLLDDYYADTSNQNSLSW